MSDSSRRTKLPPFITNIARAHVYEVIAGYIEAGLGISDALDNLELAYRERKSETAEHIRIIIDRDGAHKLGGVLLTVFNVTVAEEIALLRGIPDLSDKATAHDTALKSAAALLTRAARIAATTA